MRFVILCWVLWWVSLGSHAQVPGLFNVQGRLQVDSTLFDGTVEFKFALVNEDGSQTYWRNSSDANLDGQPDQAVPLLLSRGLYSLALGDTNLANMAALPAHVFTNSALFLRIWLNDGTHGFELLTPDQRITPAGSALISATVSDGAITAPKLAPGVLDAANLTGVLPPARLPANVAYKDTDIFSLSNLLSGQLAALTATLQTLSNQLAALQLTNSTALPPSGLTAVSTSATDAALAGYGFVPFMNVPAPAWVDGSSTDAPSARSGHSAVWTGEEIVVWGGTLGLGLYSASGGIYAPGPDQWQSISSINAPAARVGHTAVWTGGQMLIWGGFNTTGYLSSGARWQRASQAWTALPTLNAPAGRDGHVALWTGARMLIWGGRNSGGLLADGALYDPASNEWSALPLTGAPAARMGAVAEWTGSRLILWGGEGEAGPLNSGAQLTFDAGASPLEWRAFNLTDAPSGRSGHAAVWSGQKMLVWGGQLSGGELLGDGGAYDPINDRWEALPATGAPTARHNHNALWTGQELLVVGGETASGTAASGGAYNPATTQWRALSSAGNPQARSGAAAVWSGAELLTFGGSANGQAVGSLQRLNPQPAWYFYRKP
ncbi:MAG: hypothetical protein AAB676_03815 [Verrucomicrobiota bacterium]